MTHIQPITQWPQRLLFGLVILIVRKDRVVIYIVVCGQIKATLRHTADVDLFHMTKFSTYFPFTLYCFYTKRSSFMPVLTIGIVWGCFYLLMFYSEKFSTWVWRLPFVVNVHLKSVAQSRNVPRDILAEVAKFGGHSLNGFEVIQIFIEGRGV